MVRWRRGVSLRPLPLPRPMLSRAGPIPSGDGWAFEIKYDGFRAIVSTERGLEVRSRRAWNMASRVPGLAELPPGLVLDGELVSFNEHGEPHWPLVVERVLHGNTAIPITYIAFDLLGVDGHDVMSIRGSSVVPYSKDSGSTARWRDCRTYSMTATCSSTRLCGTASRGSSGSGGTGSTGPATVAGRRSRTPDTGAANKRSSRFDDRWNAAGWPHREAFDRAVRLVLWLVAARSGSRADCRRPAALVSVI